jgi:putative hydrolase of the HAD superfamily
VDPDPGIEAVLFDALGTLIELRPPAPRLVRALEDRHGIRVTRADAERALMAEMSYYRLNNHLAADSEGLHELRRRCTEVLREQLPPAARTVDMDELGQTLLDSLRFEPYPDGHGALDALRARGLRLAIVSNWDISLHDVLERTGLAPLVHTVVTSAEAGVAKPDPEIFATALRRLGCAPVRAVHVGDSLADDVEGARAAGVAPVLLQRGAGEPSRARAGGTHHGGVPVIASLSELPALVAGGAA